MMTPQEAIRTLRPFADQTEKVPHVRIYEACRALIDYVARVEYLRHDPGGHDPGSSIQIDSTGDVTDSEGVRFWHSGTMLTTLKDACKAKQERTGEPMP